APDFCAAVVDPAVNALACATARARSRASAAMPRDADRLTASAVTFGPGALDAGQRMRLLNDPDALRRLHRGVWESARPDERWLAGTPPAPCRDARARASGGRNDDSR